MLSEAGEEGGGVGPGPRVGTHTLHVVRHQRLGQLRDEGETGEAVEMVIVTPV